METGSRFLAQDERTPLKYFLSGRAGTCPWTGVFIHPHCITVAWVLCFVFAVKHSWSTSGRTSVACLSYEYSVVFNGLENQWHEAGKVWIKVRN